MQQQRDHLLVGQRSAASIHRPNAIRITICHQADIMGVAPQLRPTQRVILRRRLGANPAEHIIMLSVQRSDPAGRSRQQRFKYTRPHPKQRIMRHPQTGFRDKLEIHQLFDRREMWRPYILDF